LSPLPPWANGPFELLVHAEGHLLKGEDFDRRIALISFDDAIEVTITTYLTLHPIQRGNRTYPRSGIDKWLGNYHSRLDFLDREISARGLNWDVERSHIVWVHDHRNEQYHGGQKGTPEKNVLTLVRESALWIFGLLFEVHDVSQRLTGAILEATQPMPQRDGAFDRAIDDEYGVIELCGQRYYASELLFNVDYAAYRNTGVRLCAATGTDAKGAGVGE
jgi:hypothetical protein